METKIDPAEKRHECTTCDYTTNDRPNFNKHLERCSKRKVTSIATNVLLGSVKAGMFGCDLCGFRFQEVAAKMFHSCQPPAS